MHGDITSDKPGKCSKWGMNLVEKTAKNQFCPYIESAVYSFLKKAFGKRNFRMPDPSRGR